MSSIPNREMQGGEERGNQSGLRANFFFIIYFITFFPNQYKKPGRKIISYEQFDSA